MPLTPFPGFIGPSYTLRAGIQDVARTINLYLEQDESGTGRTGTLLTSTPGLRVLTQLAGGAIRGMYTASNGRLFVACGTHLYEVFPAGSVLQRGTLDSSQGLVSMTDDGISLTLVDGAHGYVLGMSTNTFQPIGDPDFQGATHVAYLDGMTIFGGGTGSGRFQWSAILDAANVDALDFASAEASPDPLLALLVVHRELWLFGSRTFEVWFHSGQQPAPFQRLQGAIGDIGLVAPYSATAYGDSVAWLALDPQGVGVCAMVAQGYQARRVSTHAVEQSMAQGTPQQAVAWTYSQEGHRFWLLSAPGWRSTWVYDLITQTWHERCALTAGRLEAHHCHMGQVAFQKVIGGDRVRGVLYELRLDVYDDGEGRALRRERITPWVVTTGKRLKHQAFQVDVQTGVGLDGGVLPGSDPQLMLRWSEDGQDWGSTELWRSLGKIGARTQRVIYRKLGMSRQRVYSVAVSSPVPVAFIGAHLDVEEAGH